MKRIFTFLLLALCLCGCSPLDDVYVEPDADEVTTDNETQLTGYSFSPTIESCFLLKDKFSVTVLGSSDCYGEDFINLLPCCDKSMSFVNNRNFYTVGFYTGDIEDLLHGYDLAPIEEDVKAYIITDDPTTMEVEAIEICTMPCFGSNRNFTYYAFDVAGTSNRLPINMLVMDIDEDNHLLVSGMQLSDAMISMYSGGIHDYVTMTEEADALKNSTSFFLSNLVYGDRSAGLRLNPIKPYRKYVGEEFEQAMYLKDYYITVPISKEPDKSLPKEKAEVETFGTK